MSKKKLIGIGTLAVIIIIVAAGLTYKYFFASDYNPKNTAAQVAKKEDASKLYAGKKVTVKDYGVTDPKDKDVVRTTSLYRPESKPGEVVEDEFVSLAIMTPKTDKGIARVKKEFEGFRHEKTEAVTGYGDTAYWEPVNGQLNILSHDTWYQLSVGSVDPSKHTLERTKKMADLIKDRF